MAFAQLTYYVRETPVFEALTAAQKTEFTGEGITN